MLEDDGFKSLLKGGFQSHCQCDVVGDYISSGGKNKEELTRENTESALAALLNVAQATSASAARRMQAANALLERAWGRPLQH